MSGDEMKLQIIAALATAFMAGLAPLDVARGADEVLIVSNRDGNAEIYLVELESKAADIKAEKDEAKVAAKKRVEKNLTNDPGDDHYPAWSPDGKRIVFTGARGGDYNLYVMDADGKNVRQLTAHQGKYPYCAVWSPDGRRIVYNLRDQNNLLLVLLDPATGSERPMLANVWDPAWSPDGKKIAFTKLTEEGYKIHVMEADGLNETDIGGDGNALGWSYPAWSPDGKKIAYANQVGEDVELFVSAADGKEKSRVTNLGKLNTYAAWSPDGKRILFRHTPHGGAVWPYYWIDPATLKLDVVESLKDEPALNNNLNPGRPAFRPKKLAM
jgi:Tol biopolymer transport system component